MKITGHYNLYLNPAFKSFTDIITLTDAERKREGVNVTTRIDPAFELVTVETVLAWVQAGGEVTGFPAFIEMTPEAYGQAIPEGFPHAGEAWADLPSATHTHKEIEEKHYFKTNYFGEHQEPLTGSQLLTLSALDGVEILTTAEYSAINVDGGV